MNLQRFLPAGMQGMALATILIALQSHANPDAAPSTQSSTQPSGTARSYDAAFVADDFEYCLSCHGSVGQGNPVLQTPVLAGMEPWSIRNQLAAFRKGWRGQHPADLLGIEMHAVAIAMDESQVEKAIAYLSALPAENAPPTLLGDTAAGADVYTGCVSCHGERAEGKEILAAPALAYQSDAYLLRQLTHYRDGVRGGVEGDDRGAVMKAAVQALDAAALNNVVSYIKTLMP